MAKWTLQDVLALYDEIADANKLLPPGEQIDLEVLYKITELILREARGLATDEEPGEGQTIDERLEEMLALIEGLKAYDQAGHFRGAPENGEIVYYYVGNSVRRSNFPENFAGGVARCVVAPTASTVFKVYRNDTEVGTITFAAGVRSATFASIGAFTVGDGDTLSIEAPDPADATFETLIFNLKADWTL